MSSLLIYAVIVTFWFVTGAFFLTLDLLYGWPRLNVYVLHRDISPAWPCFLFGAYSAVRLLMTWNYQQLKMRRRVAEEIRRDQLSARRHARPDEPPDPNFQFTEAPPPTDQPR
jgi:hypothetical protein